MTAGKSSRDVVILSSAVNSSYILLLNWLLVSTFVALVTALEVPGEVPGVETSSHIGSE